MCEGLRLKLKVIYPGHNVCRGLRQKVKVICQGNKVCGGVRLKVKVICQGHNADKSPMLGTLCSGLRSD